MKVENDLLTVKPVSVLIYNYKLQEPEIIMANIKYIIQKA
jgi:hypothetical protein